MILYISVYLGRNRKGVFPFPRTDFGPNILSTFINVVNSVRGTRVINGLLESSHFEPRFEFILYNQYLHNNKYTNYYYYYFFNRSNNITRDTYKTPIRKI